MNTPFNANEIGLEAPPAENTEQEVPAIVIVCPGCGHKNSDGEFIASKPDPDITTATVTCPMCQCEFEAPKPESAPETEMLTVESSAQRILGRIFESHLRPQVRKHTKRV